MSQARTSTAGRQSPRYIVDSHRAFALPDNLAGQDEFAKPKISLNIGAAVIKAKLRNYESFEVRRSFVVKDLPKFYDFAQYGIRASDELKLWGLEVDRLVGIANGTRQQYDDECVHSLVDYLTGVMIKVLLNTLDSDFWVENCVAAVAKMAAKLKVLVSDLPREVSICLEGTREVRSRMASSQKIYSLLENEPISRTLRDAHSTQAKQHEALGPENGVDAVRGYLEMMDLFHVGVSTLLMTALEGLEHDEDSGLSSDAFKTSVTIFEAPQVDASSMCGDRIRLCAERDGSIGVGGNPVEI